MKIITLNLNGIRSASRKDFFKWMARQRADAVCVQEIKAQAADLSDAVRAPGRVHGHFHYAEKKGYSGVGVYCRRAPDRVVEGIGIREVDSEGRYLRVDLGALSVVSVYLPSGSAGAHRQRAKFRFMELFLPHLKKLAAEGREVLLCGDWNIAHRAVFAATSITPRRRATAGSACTAGARRTA